MPEHPAACRNRRPPPELVGITQAAPHVPCSPTSLATTSWRQQHSTASLPTKSAVAFLFDLDELAAWRARQREPRR
jgi:hypothetical protein